MPMFGCIQTLALRLLFGYESVPINITYLPNNLSLYHLVEMGQVATRHVAQQPTSTKNIIKIKT